MKLSPENKAALVNTGIKAGIPVVGIGIGFFALRKILKRNPDGTSAQTAPSMKDMAINRENLTIGTSDAALYANILYGAMLNFGTDEKVIYSTIGKIRTKDDMLLVIKAFGMKKYLWGTRSAYLGQDINLIGWFREELDKKEIREIKPRFDSWGIPL